jgi:vesicle-associated membrane protein 1
MDYGKDIKETNIDTLKTQVNDVIDIMRENVVKIKNNYEQLEDLEHKATNLKDNSNRFNNKAIQAKNKYWWKNCKSIIILAGVIIIIIGIILIITLF